VHGDALLHVIHITLMHDHMRATQSMLQKQVFQFLLLKVETSSAVTTHVKVLPYLLHTRALRGGKRRNRSLFVHQTVNVLSHGLQYRK
jgi:hypothetical protein